MAERRMFAKTIIDSDAFIDMPLSTQALYFHLSMRADDDGFINNPKKIMRMIGASEDDYRVLCLKNFIIPFESGIVVIKHWKIHNYIRGDRKKDTVYPEEMAMLSEKANGTYSLIKDIPLLTGESEEKADETLRQKVYRESSLPYSFEYKIRQAFYGEPCPICGVIMRCHIDEEGIASDKHKPSIQHNVPISKGGKHELGNISVICHNCNVSLQDTETDKLNADKVIEKWDEICMSDKCLSSDGQMTDTCQHRLGKAKLGKSKSSIGKSIDRLGEGDVSNENDGIVENSVDNSVENFVPMVGLAKDVVFLTKDQYDSLYEKLGIETLNHYIGKLATFIILKNAKVKSHYETILKWSEEDAMT